MGDEKKKSDGNVSCLADKRQVKVNQLIIDTYPQKKFYNTFY